MENAKVREFIRDLFNHGVKSIEHKYSKQEQAFIVKLINYTRAITDSKVILAVLNRMTYSDEFDSFVNEFKSKQKSTAIDLGK